MFCRLFTVAFQGVEARRVDVEVLVSSGIPSFQIVGLPDKAVAESRDRIRASFQHLSMALPAKRITVNLAPADLQKEGSHYDVPIALGLLGALNVIDPVELEDFIALGELSLDGRLVRVQGVLPAALLALKVEKSLVCPFESSREASWAGDLRILAPKDLFSLIRHLKNEVLLDQQAPVEAFEYPSYEDMRDVREQAFARRALEVSAAGGHHLLMMGPPGVGKSMLASRFPSILPHLTPREALEVTVIHSLCGLLPKSGFIHERPFRDPHHSASTPALVGGGNRSRPGEISLAHNGVLFLDELAEFQQSTLEALRQPLETGRITVARANHHMTYPARIQLIAAMNPCRCGFFFDVSRQCSKVPYCAQNYQSKISGPLMDRFDLVVSVDDVNPLQLMKKPEGEESSQIRERVLNARLKQEVRNNGLLNAHIDCEQLLKVTDFEDNARTFLEKALVQFKLSARGYHRILRVARSIADLDIQEHTKLKRSHIAEAFSYRRIN